MLIGMTLIGFALGIVIGWVARDKAKDAVEDQIQNIMQERIDNLEEECEGLRWKLGALQDSVSTAPAETVDNETDESGAPYKFMDSKQ
jgi:hypothetical protein